MKIISIGIFVSATFLGCSSLDFFQYRENTGLYAVERPDGYGSAKFGKELTVSSTEDADFMMASAGRGERTIFYKLTENGKLKNITGPSQRYPTDAEVDQRDVKGRGSSAALAGLPRWSDENNGRRDRVTGCVAIGEPEEQQVTVHCQSVDNEYINLKPGGGMEGREFGQQLASVRPATSGGQWLLAAASENTVAVYSSPSAEDRSNLIKPRDFESDRIVELTAGRVLAPEGDESLVYVAATYLIERTRQYQVEVFRQRAEGSKDFALVACIADSRTPGFGGYMTTGDLDHDGSDELVLSAARVDGRTNVVHVYDVGAMTDTLPTCPEEDEPGFHRVAAITPPKTDDVKCDAECGFGSALTVGDIATDDDGAELVVGAYKADADGVKKSGAVYIFRGWDRDGIDEPFEGFELEAQVVDSTPTSGKEFGSNVAISPMAGRNELLIAVTGEGKIIIAFCTGVGEDIEAGGDVTENSEGKVLSTRCRQ